MHGMVVILNPGGGSLAVEAASAWWLGEVILKGKDQ
jgi:hypothetical protein